MVLEIKYVNANNAVIHTENLVTGILAKISLGPGIWAKFRLGTGIWYPPSRPSFCTAFVNYAFVSPLNCSTSMLHFFPLKYSVSPEKVTEMLDNAHHTEAILINFYAKKHVNGKTTTYTS